MFFFHVYLQHANMGENAETNLTAAVENVGVTPGEKGLIFLKYCGTKHYHISYCVSRPKI